MKQFHRNLNLGFYESERWMGQLPAIDNLHIGLTAC
jgi:hypothetical protein